jgi:hypothetical protein
VFQICEISKIGFCRIDLQRGRFLFLHSLDPNRTHASGSYRKVKRFTATYLALLEVGLFRQFAPARCEGYLSLMKRQLIALIVILALGLQGSLVAFAASAMVSDCTTSAASPDTSKSCCPSGLHTASCCLDVCLATVAVTVSPASLVWYGRKDRALPFHTAIFASHGDSPLIRPPIL